LTYFESNDGDEIACGALHPDGLIYAVGTTAGKLSLWDFKSQKLAATMGGGDDAAAMEKIVFSSNGYHLATVAANGKATIWDLKKQASLVVLDSSSCDGFIPLVTAIAFDPSGKFVVYGGDKGMVLTAVKEWTVICQVAQAKLSHLAWTTNKQIVSASMKERTVRFYGLTE
jgi:pre-mRNA-processing factor 19